jgi:hypothetical protein
MKQEQKGGSNSHNTQIGVVVTGMSYDDVRSIALDVFEHNFAARLASGQDQASARAGAFRDELIEQIAKENLSTDVFAQPEKVQGLFEAQKAFALSGDESLKTTLIQAVIDLSKAPERSLNAIVLGEAIKVLPSLTKRQLAIITASFAVRFVTVGVSSLPLLLASWQKFIGPEFNGLDPTDGDMRHLEYCGCAKRTMFSSANLHSLFTQVYPGLISKGFPADELTKAFEPEGLPSYAIAPCQRVPGNLQIAVLPQPLREAVSKNWTPRQREVVDAKLKENLLSEAELKAELENDGAFGSWLTKTWNTRFSSLELTSVGMAVGHSMAKSREPAFAPLEVWL